MPYVVFVLVPGLHLLDLAGPAQVFSTAAEFGHPYELVYVAEHERIPTAQGLPVYADTTWPSLTPDDLILIPGWTGDSLPPLLSTPTAAPRDPTPPQSPAPVARSGGGAAPRGATPAAGVVGPGVLGVIAEHHAGGGTVASVCAGADALGRAGLLDGRRCTTHHGLQDELAGRYPAASVVRDVLYVVDDRVVTSAGIASGIDLALHLIAMRHGPGAAAQVAREMVVYVRRNGDERQASALLRHRSHVSDTAHRVQDLIDARFDRRLSLAELADAAHVSERTLTRLFKGATGVTPLRYQQALRVERAEHLIQQGATVEAAAQEVGFKDARMLRRLRAAGR